MGLRDHGGLNCGMVKKTIILVERGKPMQGKPKQKIETMNPGVFGFNIYLKGFSLIFSSVIFWGFGSIPFAFDIETTEC